MMIRRLVSGVFVLLLVTPLQSCGGSKSPVASADARPPFSIGLDFNPSPPQVGNEQFTVTLRDGSGAAITGANVRIEPSYETIPGGHLIAKTGMGGVSAPIAATDGGNGSYHASMVLAKPVYWTFSVQAQIGSNDVVTYQKGVQVQQ
jgi:hypothetical protein